MVFPHWCPPAGSVLFPWQEVEGFPILPRSGIFVRRFHLGPLQPGEHLALRSYRLVVQPSH